MREPTRREAGRRLVASAAAPPALPRADTPRPEPVTLAARRLAHHLNNDLALQVGVLELLAGHVDLPAHLRGWVADARQGVLAAARHVEEFQRLL